MSITKEQIIETISRMSITEMMELISMIEKKFGVSSEQKIFTNDRTDQLEKDSEKPKEEQTEFDVILSNIGNNKISVIKAVRSCISLGLKESKDLVESAPILLKENVTKEVAESLKKKLEEAGASVEIK